VFGASSHCFAVQISDLCLALAALDARVEIDNGDSTRMVTIAQFHRLPGTTPELDANLQPGEVVTGIELPMSSSVFANHFQYLKIGTRGRDSAPISVAVALLVQEGTIGSARIALGGVAHKPWRAVQAEKVLVGERKSNSLYWFAAEAALQPASANRTYSFKVELIRQAIVRALALASGMDRGAQH
jgi:xanthine dehydrogenase YagS FAD-binding subunit